MDRKSTVVTAVCLFLIVLWTFVVVPKLYPPKPLPPGATNELAAAVETNAQATTVATATNAATAAPTPVATANVAATEPTSLATNAPEHLLVVSNDNASYTFTSRGGALALVELLHYPETIARSGQSTTETNQLSTLNSEVCLPTMALLDGPAVEGDNVYTLARTTDGVRAEKTLTNGLRIVKDFQLTNDYLVNVSVRLENTSTQALALPEQQWTVGTATPMNSHDKTSSYYEGMMWYDGSRVDDLSERWFANYRFGCVPGVPRAEFRGGNNDVAWAAVHNQYFALALVPQKPAAQIVARKVNLPPPTAEEIQADSRILRTPFGLETSLIYPGLTLAPQQTEERHFYLYAGPKEYRTLARIASRLGDNLDAVMNFGKYTGFFSKGLLLGMNWLHAALHLSYGWAIVAITVIIKLLFWPLTQASTRSMKRMQALQPQMKALQAKYKDDPTKLNQKMMEFWKEHKVNPMGGCLPMMLQMPVFFGFYYMIRSAIELRGASFLWVKDLSMPDTLFMIPGINFPFNLLPLIMGGVMLWQSHLTPPSPGVDPAQQKIMRYMPLMILVFLYNYSAGLALYWTVQNLLTVAQTKLTRTNQPVVAPASVLTPPPKRKK